jgi:hypothetical protein
MNKLILGVAALLAMAVDVMGVDLERNSLKGITGLGVWIGVNSDAEQAGLHSTEVQTDVELKLRLAGIKVLTNEEVFKDPNAPILFVRATLGLDAVKESGGYAYHAISCQLYQHVFLARDMSIGTLAATWESASTGMIRSNAAPKLRENIKDCVDEFLNAYLSVNPKK